MASGSRSAHVVLLAFPQTGHTNPMLQFLKNLASQGVHTTFLSFDLDHQRMLKAEKPLQSLGIRVRFEFIPDYLPPGMNIISDILYICRHLQNIQGSDLEDLIHRLNETGPPVTCIVHDAFMPWVAQVSHSLNIPRAVFYTQSATVGAIYHHFKYGEKWNNREWDSKDVVVVPEIGEMRAADLPSTFFPPLFAAGVVDDNLRFVETFNGASWVILNTFDELEDKALKYLRELANVAVCTVGPLIPSAFLNGRNEKDTEVGGSPWEAETEECMKWLDSKPLNSVVYVSFGSIASISTQQVQEIGRGLQSSGQFFLWAIRPAAGKTTVWESFWEGFEKDIGDRGLIVKWSPQLRVLNHPSVGAFMSHCGWNSTLEAVSSGVPLIGCDLLFDQPTNCKFLVEVWKMGIKLKRAEQIDDVMFEWDEIERCVRRVICSGEGEELRKNAVRWKESARKATMEGGSSHSNVHSFVTEVTK